MSKPKGLGYLIQDKRRAKGVSVEELAEKTGLSVSTVRGLEQGRRLPSVTSLRPILDYLELELDWINESSFRLEDGTVYHLAAFKGGHARVTIPRERTEVSESLRLRVIQKILDADLETVAAIDRLITHI